MPTKLRFRFRFRFYLLGLAVWLSAIASAGAQQYMPIPPNSVIGNVLGQSGPSYAITFKELLPLLTNGGNLGTPSAGIISTGMTLGGVTMGLGADATGDIYYNNGGVFTRLPKGSNGQALEMVSGLPAWASVPGTGTINTAGLGLSLTGGGSTLGIDYTHNNVWTGTNAFANAAYFGGVPWVDVKSGANGCAAAVGNNSTDDSGAIQCQVNYMNTTHGGGIVFFPPASGYHFASGVNVPAGVWLEGAGLSVSSIQVTTDISPITFSISSGTCPSGGHHGGMEKMSVYGYQNAAATSNAVTIGNNCAVTLRDNQIWFGSSGLFNKGVDSYIENNFICGYSASVTSNGANWYVRDKLDTCGISSTFGFLQGTPISGVTTAENHFTQTDFSGSFTYSVNINDPTDKQSPHLAAAFSHLRLT